MDGSVSPSLPSMTIIIRNWCYFCSWVSVMITLLSSMSPFKEGPVAWLLRVLSASILQVSAPSGSALIVGSQFIQGHSPSQEDLLTVTNRCGNKGLDILTHLKTTQIWKTISKPSYWVGQTYNWTFLIM